MIDFDQLKIENQQYLERIEEKNKELLQLKLTTGKTVQVRRTVVWRRCLGWMCSLPWEI